MTESVALRPAPARFWPQGWWKVVEFRIGIAADDDRSDEEVKKVGRLRELGNRLQHALGEEVRIHQVGRHKGGEDRRRAEVADHRQRSDETRRQRSPKPPSSDASRAGS